MKQFLNISLYIFVIALTHQAQSAHIPASLRHAGRALLRPYHGQHRGYATDNKAKPLFMVGGRLLNESQLADVRDRKTRAYLPKPSLGTVSKESRDATIKRTVGTGLAGVLGVSMAAYLGSVDFELMIIPALAVGMGAGISHGVSFFGRIKEAKMYQLVTAYRVLEEEACRVAANPFFDIAATKADDLNALRSAVEAVGFDKELPLVEAFESWKCSHQQFARIQSDAAALIADHEKLAWQVPGIFAVPLNAQLIPDVSHANARLKEAMQTIKRVPDWLNRLDSYHHKLAKEASERAEKEAIGARKAAEQAASDAGFAATMSTVAALSSILRR